MFKKNYGYGNRSYGRRRNYSGSGNPDFSQDELASFDPIAGNKNKPAVFPRYKIRLETENHYAQFYLRPKNLEEFTAQLPAFCEKILSITGNQVTLIEETSANGRVREIFRAPKGIWLPGDAKYEGRIKLTFNQRDVVSIILERGNERAKVELPPLLISMFHDSLGKAIQQTDWIDEWDIRVPQWQLKKNQHPLYNVPHSEAPGSHIEVLFENALEEAKVQFKKQEPIVFDNQLLTRPDFLIEDPLIAIYCDGTEYHKDVARIIKDKQQDRILQRHGYFVLRFSGSEIVAKAEECVRELCVFIRVKKGPSKI